MIPKKGSKEFFPCFLFSFLSYGDEQLLFAPQTVVLSPAGGHAKSTSLRGVLFVIQAVGLPYLHALACILSPKAYLIAEGALLLRPDDILVLKVLFGGLFNIPERFTIVQLLNVEV